VKTGQNSLSCDLAVVNAKIHTMDSSLSTAEALAVHDSRIISVGKNDEIKPLMGKKTTVLDAKGKTVLPGFIDAHHHFQIASRTLNLMAQCHTPPHESIDDVIQVLREWAGQIPEDEWIIGQGCLLQDRKLKERRFPTKHDLDKVSKNRPVVLRFGMHVTLLNSKALDMLNVSKDSPTPKGATIEKDSATNEPTGVTRDFWNFIPIPEATDEQLSQAMEKYILQYCAANGVTSIQDLPESRAAVDIYQKLLENNEGKLNLRMRFYYEVPNMIQMDQLLATGFRKGFGNDYVRLGGVKIFVDGGMTSANALFHDPYTFSKDHYGKLAIEPDTLSLYVRQAYQADLQVLMHAAGDKANDIALDAVETAFEKYGARDHRFRIEHMGNVYPQMHRFERAKKIGVLPVPNMGFINSWADQLVELVGNQRGSNGFWCRKLIDNGFPIPGNSDATGTHPENSNPFFCMGRAVNRKTFSGKLFSPEEKISVTEAVKMYTNHAAFAGFEEHEKGSLEVGKFGDLIVVSENPWETPENQIESIKTLCTVVGGRIIYNIADF